MKSMGYIATGGSDGLLKVLKLAPTQPAQQHKLSTPTVPTNLTINQNLDGHSGAVQVVEWNELYQKLTTTDSNGLIIVWMTQRDNWYEEMINNRNKSVVIGMAWSHNGAKIVIAYKDGQVIVGSVDGNRLWSKDIAGSLVAVCWSADSSMLFFGMMDGEVQAYDAMGTFIQKVHMICLENVELEVALSKELPRETIVSMEWFVPAYAPPSALVAERQAMAGRPSVIELPMMQRRYVPEDRPRFHVTYKNGVTQMMRNENDINPVIIKLPNIIVSKARWSPDGSMIAICGIQTDFNAEKCVVHFVSAYGEPLRILQIPGQTITDISWEGEGLRLCAAVDCHLFFANIRPNYKWAYCGQTVVYMYERAENNEHCVVFFETKLEEAYPKYVKQLVAIAAYGEHCVLVSRVDDQIGQYFVQICNGIGTPVDTKYTNLEPKFVAMNDSEVVIANPLSFIVWRYNIPRGSNREFDFSTVGTTPDGRPAEQIYYVDKNDQIGSALLDSQRRKSVRQRDEICAVGITKGFILICRESGAAQRYTLPAVTLHSTLNLGCRVEKLELNCTGKRLAVLTGQGLKLFELLDNSAKLLNFERKDAWNIKWDAEKDDTIAVIEKTRMYVVRNTEADEPILNSGYICSFKNLIVRTVLLDEIMKNPETPHKSFIIDVEIKALRDAKILLEKMKIQEATAFIEKNNHPKLWALLAEVALNRLDTAVAEHAYVMLNDYAGIQLIKRINALQNDEFKKAEIAAFYGRVDEAEKIYMANDRRDLAIAVREKMGDWFRIMEILQKSSAPGDDELLRKAWAHVGDYYAERRNWKQAASYYEKSESHEQLIRCYLMNDDYDGLELLAKQLPDHDKLIVEIGEIFAGAGLCEQAVQCFTRCDMLNEALDVCIQLNRWEYAVQLSKTYSLRDVDSLLSRYTEQLTGSNEKTLAAVQLYRRAGKFLKAARIVFDIANDERLKQAQPLRLKKLYVLGALLVEQYHEQSKAEIAKDSPNKTGAEIALKGLLKEDSTLSLDDSSLIDNAWRGAEAYHFYMLAHRQLYSGDLNAAMKTALHLTDYEDLIDPVDIYSLLALTSCATQQFAVCSQAFIKLETLDTFTEEERNAYKKLALNIFTKYPPKDTRVDRVECTGCDAQIPDYSQICPSCDVKFPTCVVTGRPLFDYRFWLCPTCKHRAYEQEVISLKFCPFCHGAV